MKKYYSIEHICLLLLFLLVTYPVLAQQTIFTGTIIDNTVITMNIDDELIPIGYGLERRKEEVTSAIGIVKADELTKSSVMNPANALFGKIPGLTVLQNGGTNWNNDPNLYIRGVETFGLGTNQILMIVDGFERPVQSLSLAEIESVAILKDAAALAMYGMRGANGVLLVTTKRGTGKGLSIDVNYERGITTPFRLPDFQDSYGYAKAVNQALANDGLTRRYTQTELDRFQSGNSPYLYPNVHWLDEGLRDFGISDKFNISFQEQAKSVRYFTVINYENEQGLFGPVNENVGYSTQSGIHQLNFRANIDVDLFKSTKLSVKLAGNIGESRSPGMTSENDIFSAIYNTPSAAYPVRTYNNEWGGTSTYENNPVALISASGYTVMGNRELMTDFLLEQNLDNVIKGLSAEAGISFDNSLKYIDEKTKQFQYEQVSPIIDAETEAIIDTVETLYGTNTSLVFSTSIPMQRHRTTAFADLKYAKDWEDNEFRSVLILQSEELILTGRYNTYRHLLAAGNLHYSKAGKYFSDLSLSYNGTNRLPKGSRFGFFPALSFAWKLSNEEWLIENPIIDNLKIRVSWGMSGNDQVIQNISTSTWVNSKGYYFGSNNTSNVGIMEGQLGSSPLTYETSYKSNIGIDASMFKMLDMNLDVFYNKRKGILVGTDGSISSLIGVQLPYSSAGITSNKGVELGLNLHKNKRDLSYHIGGQLSYSQNKIIDMLEGYRSEEYLKRTGQSIDQAFGLESIGFYKDDADIAVSPQQTFSIIKPGDIKYKDQNGDNIINSFDEVPIGYSTTIPELYFSGTLGLKYKGVGIEAFLQGIANQTVYLNTPSIFWPLRGNTSITTYSDGSWSPETAATATLPRLSMSENANNNRPNTIWHVDGSYLKLRSLELYFNLPKQFVSKCKLNEARLYVRGMNLFSIDNIRNVDPEAIGNTYPTVSSYNLGINIGF